jgi:ribosomal protein S18 acetylase RimI-like enzyme
VSSINSRNSKTVEDFWRAARIGDVFSWREIGLIHRVRHGVYHKNGRLISLLTDFGKINPCYPDAHGEDKDTIFYTGAGRRGDQKLDAPNQALFNAVETKHAVPLFNKLKVGVWQFLGFWKVVRGEYIFDETRNRMVWKFTLEKVGKMSEIEIRKYKKDDEDAVWEIIKYVAAAGDSFTLPLEPPREETIADWTSAEKHVFVAVSEGEIVATFYIKPNQTGPGSHIANGGYMVSPDARGLGIGRKIGEFSIAEAKRLGFQAMQFNFVVKSNEKAVRLWRNLGFEIVGEIPEAFRHKKNGLTNALIMYRKL